MSYFKTADGTELFYSVWGKGHPLVLIHGGNIGADVWEFQVPYLVDHGYSCIVYDQRGFTRSDCSAGGYNFDTFADDLAGLINHLNLQRFSVVAFSHGGCVLGRYLSRHGDSKIDKVVLLSTILPAILKSKDNPEGVDRSLIFDPFYASMQKDRASIFRASLDEFFAPATADTQVSESTKDWIMGVALRSSLMPMLEVYKSSHETDFRKDLKLFGMPTLIIHGQADVFAPPAATAQRVHSAIPGSKLELYPGASHGLFFTHQDRLNQDIAGFFGKELGARI
jgi:non-heme chloroperoxidase